MSAIHLKTLFETLRELGGNLRSKAKVKDVHKLRTTCRRIDTVLRAQGNGSGRSAKKVLKVTKRLRRGAGRVRDLDVQLKALEEMDGRVDGDEKDVLVRKLEKARRKREKKLRAAVRQEFNGKVKKRLRKTERRFGNKGQGEKPYAVMALEQFATVAQDFPELEEANLHQFRIACKGVRYTAEMDGSALGETVVAESKRMTDGIGDWHDLVTLSERAQEVVRKSKGTRLVEVLREAEKHKLEEALQTTAAVKEKLLQLHAENSRLAEMSAASEMAQAA